MSAGLPEQQPSDQEAGEHEEHVDADEAAGDEADARMGDNDEEDRDRAEALDVGAMSRRRPREVRLRDRAAGAFRAPRRRRSLPRSPVHADDRDSCDAGYRCCAHDCLRLVSGQLSVRALKFRSSGGHEPLTRISCRATSEPAGRTSRRRRSSHGQDDVADLLLRIHVPVRLDRQQDSPANRLRPNLRTLRASSAAGRTSTARTAHAARPFSPSSRSLTSSAAPSSPPTPSPRSRASAGPSPSTLATRAS